MATVRTTGGRIASKFWLPLVAAWLLLLPAALLCTTPARADGCSIGDIVNGLVQTIGSFTSGTCAGACTDGVGCGAAAGIAAGLGTAAAVAGQGSVDTFCSDLNSAVNGLGDIQSALGPIPSDVSSTIISTLNDLGDPLTVAQCACSLEQGANQVVSGLAACWEQFEQGLCQVMNFGQSCTCSPPPPAVADCSYLQNSQCGSTGPNYDPNKYGFCYGSGANGQTIVQGYDPGSNSVQNISPYPPAQQTVTSAGTEVSIANGSCGGVSYCFCPKPMEPTWTLDGPENDLNPNNCGACANHSSWYVFSCNCPKTTHPDPSGKLVNGVPVCICDGTSNQVANLSSNALFGWCPPPDCPAGQIRLTGNGQCITPCSDPTKGMTMTGACCDPNQTSACGQCCPPHWTPNPATGGCQQEVAQ
jgi:hypothetical protein